MQKGTEQLKAQQEIMKARGVYNGAIDGIWGPKTIEAKIRWERGGKFTPGIPNGGFPLVERGPLPTGVRRQADGTLTCVELLEKAQVASVAPPPAPTQNNNNQNNNQNNQNRNGKQHSNNPHANQANQNAQAAEKSAEKPIVTVGAEVSSPVSLNT